MRVLFLCFLAICFKACSDSNEPTDNSCTDIIISSSIFQNSDQNQVSIIDASIIDDCITVKLGVSGCDDSQVIDMISSGEVLKSLPVQMTFDFKIEEPQVCLAFFEVEREYDLSSLKEIIDDEIILRFRNSDFTISYNK